MKKHIKYERFIYFIYANVGRVTFRIAPINKFGTF